MTNNIQFSSVCGIDIVKSVMQVCKVISGTPAVVKYFRVKFFLSLAKQDSLLLI